MSQDEKGMPTRVDWDKCVSAAYLRYMGKNQTDAAVAVGVVRETLSRWERSPWWTEAQREAEERWLQGLAAKAREGLEEAVSDDGNLALKVLERIDRRLAPPSQRSEVTFPDGPPVVRVEWGDASDADG